MSLRSSLLICDHWIRAGLASADEPEDGSAEVPNGLSFGSCARQADKLPMDVAGAIEARSF